MENLGRDELLPVSVESSSTTSDPPLSMTVSKQKFAGGAAAASAASKRQRSDQRGWLACVGGEQARGPRLARCGLGALRDELLELIGRALGACLERRCSLLPLTQRRL